MGGAGLKALLKKGSTNIDRKIYSNRDFVIISNNCWGGEIYQRLGKAYNTPFIGLFLYGPDYLKLLENFDYYLSLELEFIAESKRCKPSPNYPVALLGDLEIHFVHYKDEQESRDKWTRRLARMFETVDRDKYFFKICDRDGTTQEMLMKYHELPFKNKISFGRNTINNPNHILIPEGGVDGVPDGVRLYKIAYHYFDVLNWINKGSVKSNFYSKIKRAGRMV